jgi:DNA-directed RNA polymerase specialized sigma subunit
MAGGVIKGELTLQYQPWIKKLTRRMWVKFGKFHDFNDMLSVAQIASLESERLYNPSKAKFSAYVKSRIEGAIIRSVTNLSTGQHKLLAQLHKFIDNYLVLHDFPPAQHIILHELQITEADLYKLLSSTDKITLASIDDVPEQELNDSLSMDDTAEYDKVQKVIATLSLKQQKEINKFLEDQTVPSAKIQDILGIIRTRLQIKD